MINIVEVSNCKEQKDFLDFPLKMYKGNPYFVPPLYGDEKKMFTANYVYYDTCEAVYYNAYRDGVMVGRISGILQKASNAKMGENRVRFTRFDAINDQIVADALFGAVENWAKQKGMDTVCGPLGFSDLEREGLLIEGFDQLSTFEEQYNYEYYQTLIENCGYVKEVDWLERKVYRHENIDPHLINLTDAILKKYNLRFGTAKNVNHFIKKYCEQIFELLDVTYANLYSTVPFTDNTRKLMVDNFRMIVSLRHISVIVDENDKVVCFGICFPSIAKAVQKSGGKLTIPTIFRLLKAIKRPRIIDMGLVGVTPEYASKGVSNALIIRLNDMLAAKGVEYAETNLNLEDNHNIQNQWKRFNAQIHKRRRAYVKKL